MKIAVYTLSGHTTRSRILLNFPEGKGFRLEYRLSIAWDKEQNSYRLEPDPAGPIQWSPAQKAWTGNTPEAMPPTGKVEAANVVYNSDHILFTYHPIPIRDVGAKQRIATLQSRKAFNSHAEKLAAFHSACSTVLLLSKELNIHIRFHPDIGFYTPLED